MLFEIRLDSASHIRNAENQPVEKQHGQAGVVLRKVAAVRTLCAENPVEPIQMIEIAGENAENFQLEPAHLEDDPDQSDRQHHTRREAVDCALAQTACQITQQKRYSS